MNRFTFYLSGLLSFFLLMVLTGCTAVSYSESKTEWTFLFYNDADFSPGHDPMLIFAENMFSGENLNVLVLRDPHKKNSKIANDRMGRSSYDSTAAIYLVDHQREFNLLKELGEVSMGSPKTLSDFIMYAKTLYPAERYILSIYGHGGGISGACSDDTNGYDWLRMNEMKEGLKNSGGVDMIIFSAPCLMGEVGAAYELRDYTDVYIGSENLSLYIYWEKTMGDIQNILNNRSSIHIHELGREIVNALENNLTWIESQAQGIVEQTTMSAFRQDKITGLVPLLNDIFTFYLNHQDRFNLFMDTHYSEIQSYYDWNIDLISFLEKLSEFESGREIQEKLNQLVEKIQEVILEETHGSAVPGSHGLAIYHPNKNTKLLNADLYHVVDFGRHTHWDELLVKYFGPDKILNPQINRQPTHGHGGISPFLPNKPNWSQP